jgi:hypothetical protein
MSPSIAGSMNLPTASFGPSTQLRMPRSTSNAKALQVWKHRLALTLNGLSDRGETGIASSMPIIDRLGGTMLELRPTCEHCNKALPPASLEARICSYECTFCEACVAEVLGDVCPNCGGGFVPRPIRPSNNWKGDNFLGKDPPSAKVKHRPVDAAIHALFSAKIRAIRPEKR